MESKSNTGEKHCASFFAGVPIAAPQRNGRISSGGGSFRCTFHGCGKSYSRAGHLYRHRLNHAPKHIYVCDFCGCYRSFVRRDLLDRHKARHINRQASLGKCGHSHSPQASCGTSTEGPSAEASFSDLLFEQISIAGLGYDRSLNLITETCAKPSAAVVRSSPSTPSKPHTSPPRLEEISPNCSLGQQAADEPPCAQEATQPSLQDDAAETSSRQAVAADTFRFHFSQDPSNTATEMNDGFDSDGAYLGDFVEFCDPFHDPEAALPVMLNEDATVPSTAILPSSADSANDLHDLTLELPWFPPDLDLSLLRAASTSSAPSAGSVFDGNPFDPPSSGNGDEFTAWLFNDPSPVSTDGLQSVVDLGDDVFGLNEGQTPPTVAGTAEYLMSCMTGQQQVAKSSLLSQRKRQKLLKILENQGKTTQNQERRRRDAVVLEGDVDDDDHVLSLTMMNTYIHSYWHYFHKQLPIMHYPTFCAETSPSALVLAIMAIGASALDRIHGPVMTRAVARLSHLIIQHLRWQIFIDQESFELDKPTKLWVLQSLVLITVYEKTHGDRLLHERASLHHETSLTLLRCGVDWTETSQCSVATREEGGDDVASAAKFRGRSDTTHADALWIKWADKEAAKRAMFAIFFLETTQAAMFGSRTGLSEREIRLTMPCDEGLWSAASALQASQIQPGFDTKDGGSMPFLGVLKDVIGNKQASETAFGKLITLAGLLKVAASRPNRALANRLTPAQLPRPPNPRKSVLLCTFGIWSRDFLSSESQEMSPTRGSMGQPIPKSSNSVESRDALHCLACISLFIDITDCFIFSGATRLVKLSADECNAASRRILQGWTASRAIRDAAFYAVKFLTTLFNKSGVEIDDICLARDELVFGRPWIVFVSALVIWCYGFAVDGPLASAPPRMTKTEQRRDMQAYLQSLIGVKSPQDLENLHGRNRCLGMLMILRDTFATAQWTMLSEAATVLDTCIEKLENR